MCCSHFTRRMCQNLNVNFDVCNSVHHHTIQTNHQPDGTVFQFIILTSVYSSTCFGRFSARHQVLNDCSGSLWFYLRIVVTVVLCSWSGRPASASKNSAFRPGSHVSHFLGGARCGDARHRTTLIQMYAENRRAYHSTDRKVMSTRICETLPLRSRRNLR
jgi:hypothetical protein